jgi:hypothetical protein
MVNADQSGRMLQGVQTEKAFTLRESRSASGPGIVFENTSARALYYQRVPSAPPLKRSQSRSPKTR